MSQRILVVALDGADFRLLRPWMDAGELPHLAALAREGVHGPLRSVVPPLTPPAWASFATGKHPGRHGVFGFTRRGKRSEEPRPVTGADIRGAALWDYLREFGVRSAVVGVPMTYPPPPVAGGLVSCFMTPPGRRNYTHPPELLAEIEARFGPYPLYLDAPVFSANLSAATVERFLRVLEDEADAKFRVAGWLAERCEARLVMLHVWGTDRIQHELWNLLDATHPQHRARLAARVRGPIMDYFRGLDRRIGALREALGDEVTTLVVSDHGFGPVYYVIDLNTWLAREGFIRFRRRAVTWLRRLAWRCGLTASALTRARVAVERYVPLRRHGSSPVEQVRRAQRHSRRLVLSFRDVDWQRTTAFSPPGLSIGSLVVNVRGREPAGSVAPGAEYEAVRARLVERLGALGRRLGLDEPEQYVTTSETLYGARHDDEGAGGASVDGAAPDVLFLPLEAGYLPTNLFDFLGNRPVTKSRVWPGNHRMDGVLIAHGPAVRSGQALQGARIIDVAPTLLHLLGCPVPSDMDGRPLTEMLRTDPDREHPVRTCEPVAPSLAEQADLTDAERDEIMARLRSLGYL
jgi:predicted AlkP superfamily phosphohydrolase/phosphomutase